MKSRPVEFLESVEGDLRHAYAYYDSWLTGGSDSFRERVMDTVTWISWNPEMFPKKYRFFRRAIVRRSYFGIYFVIEPEVATVVALLDMRQNPHMIRRLLTDRAGPGGST